VIEEGDRARVWIRSSNKFLGNSVGVQMLDETGIVLKSWFSLKECSKDLGITVPGVSKRIKRNIQFTPSG
jgi:hypothetical protein